VNFLLFTSDPKDIAGALVSILFTYLFVGTREMVGCVFFSVIFRTLWTIPFIKLFLFLTFLFLIIAC